MVGKWCYFTFLSVLGAVGCYAFTSSLWSLAIVVPFLFILILVSSGYLTGKQK